MENNINPINDINQEQISVDQNQHADAPKNGNSKKFNLTVLIIAITMLIIAIAVAGFFVYRNYSSDRSTGLTPTPTVTSSTTPSETVTLSPTVTTTSEEWKTYSGQLFTFDYPPNWEVSTPTSTRTLSQDIYAYFVVDVEFFGMGVDPNFDSFKEYPTKVDGITTNAKEWTWSTGSNDFLISFEVTHNNTRYGFRLGGARGVDRSSARATLMKMVDTFKFRE